MTSTLTPSRLDAVLERPKPDRIIWTAGGIAARLGCGEDFVRKTLALLPGSPIRKKGRRLYAFEGELIDWMKDVA
ncbi:MAG TPA: hypothetical protein DIT93_09130 [Pelagibacterium sp.]|uniref:hypothetical protein n=1 Tax=uncultured Pelagibacterium sp. TaxID=1159875 RepID=UPI000C5D7DC8|nr:hypothetical protein [Pelagibacterium sp.]HCO55166.1 hypothetical protein [Pelagibacterium sp.]|tara:strand:+ start:284 stop:508 length:225 start_codon:yes stop_codon:yes gene_type:complete